jgi:hypothetical protein
MFGNEKKPSRALEFKGWRSMKGRASLMRINPPRGASMGLNADASLVPSADVGRNHYGGRRVKVTGRNTSYWRIAPTTAQDRNPKQRKFQGGSLLACESSGSYQLDWTWSWHVPRRPERSRAM